MAEQNISVQHKNKRRNFQIKNLTTKNYHTQSEDAKTLAYLKNCEQTLKVY